MERTEDRTGRALRFALTLALVAGAAAEPAGADLSAFVAAVGFDEEANLNGGVGAGLRWGKSSGLIGGETSLLIARPERELGVASESATAFFYEGRFLVNLPLAPVKPFVGIGFGAITITSTDKIKRSIEQSENPTQRTLEAAEALSDLQTNSALSYGAGVRYSVNKRVDVRADLRQYLVFSVAGAARQKVAEEVSEQVGIPYEKKDLTVQYNELSAGVVFRF